MNEMKENIQKLCNAIGVAGLENNASQIAADLLCPYVDEVRIDAFGNVIGKLSCQKENAKTILLDAHIDEIGMIVVAIDDKGYLKIGNCGGIDRRLLAGQEVLVHCDGESLLGVVGSKPPHLEKGDEAKQVPDLDSVFLDIGMTKEQAEQKVKLGDRVTIRSTYRELLNNRVSVKSLDDRCGVVSILEALKQLKKEALNVNVAVLFSAQEEIGSSGAKVAAFGTAPDYAIAVDVSFALTPDAPAHKCGKMGEGVMIGVSALLNKQMSDRLIALAKEKGIPYQLEVLSGRSTGTNADVITTTKTGVITGLLSIPQKYMHTPIETMELTDIKSVADLLAAYVQELD